MPASRPAPAELTGAAAAPPALAAAERSGAWSARADLWIPAAYAALSGAWIAVSDLILGEVATSARDHVLWSLTKGLGFVGVTALLLHLGVRWALAIQRRAEREVAASDALLRAIAEAVPDPMFVKDAEGRWLFANRALEPVVGRTPSELVGRTDREIYRDPAIADALVAHDRAVMVAGASAAFEERVETLAGVRIFLSTKSPLRDAAGRVVGVVGVARDITERKRVEQGLAEAGVRQAFLVGLGDALRALSDPLDVQRAAARILGEHLRATRVHYAEVSGDGVTGVVHADWSPGLPSVAGTHRFDDHGRLVMDEFRAGRTLVVHDVGSDPRLAPAERAATAALRVGAYVLVPLRKSGRAVAVLVAHQEEPRTWTADEVSIVEETAERTWAAVERARAEAALRESEARYRLLADHAHDVIWTLDLATRSFTYVSPSIEQLRGLTVAEAMREPLEASLTPESLAKVSAAMARIGTSEERAVIIDVYDQPCRDGSVKHVEITTAVVRDAEGRPRQVVGVSRDATARVRAERALEERERHLRTILETALDGFAVVGPGARILDVNGAFCRMTGYAREELLALHVHDLEAAEKREAVAERARRVQAEGAQRFETRHRRKDGTLVDVEVSLQRADLGGERIVSFVRDITESKRARDAVAASERRFRALIEKSTDMINVLDARGRYSFWSQSAAEGMGWTPEEMLGRSSAEILHPEDRDRAAALLERLAAMPGEVAKATLRIRHKDGSWRLVENTGRNLLHDPAVQGIVVNARDVTAQRLLEDQLRQAQKLESIGRLAGGVAHDFNNLLTVILSCADELLDDGTAPATRREDAEEIRAAARRAGELTRQLLAFARKQVIAPVPLDLSEVVRGTQKLLQRVLGEDVRLVTQLAPGLPAVRADPGQLEQVIMNLAVNARDAMPRGGTLTIETRGGPGCAAAVDGAAAGPWVQLLVRDSGTGMSEEVKAHLFEPFFTTKRPGQGTGLGLATVHGAVGQAGGHVHVESEVGRGTAVTVCLPVTADAAVRAEQPAAGSARGREAVLVVEDDAQVRRVTMRTLERAGYRVVGAGDAAEALDRFREGAVAFDLVVTDVIMPGLSGRALVAELERLRPGIRALYVSGYTRDALASRDVADEGIHFLPKPFTPATLLDRVREVLAAAR